MGAVIGGVVVAVVVGGERAAATAATAAGLKAIAASSSGDSVVGEVTTGDGVLVGTEGRPEWSMGAGSGTGDRGRMPETPGCGPDVDAAGSFFVIVMSWR